MSSRTRAGACAAAVGVMGCGVQATGGTTFAGQSDVRGSLTVGMSTNVPRQNAGVVGVRFGSLVENGITPKHLVLHGGYDFRFWRGAFVLEPGFDLGGGSPVDRSYGGVGAYAGASGSARFRVLGTSEEPAFNLFGFGVEFLVVPRAGAWMPPEGSGASVTSEYALEAGFRLVMTSDLFTENQGKVQEPQQGDRR